MVLIRNNIWPTKITPVIYGCSCQVCVHPYTVTMYAIHTPYIMSTCALNLMDKKSAVAIVVLQLSVDLTILDFLGPHVCINRSWVTLITLFVCFVNSKN